MVPARSSTAHRSFPPGLARLGAILAVAAIVAACGSTGATASPSPSSSAVAGASPSPAATATVEPTAAASASATAAPTSTPTTAPTATPTTAPNQPPAFACTKLPYLRGTDFESVRVADVRVGTHAGYDRMVFEFGAGKFPDIEVRTAKPPFKLDPSDLPVTIDGTAFLKIRLNHVAVETIPSDADDIKPGYPVLVELRQTTGYEGDAVWIAGLSGPACVRVSIFKAPARLVVDVAPAG